MNDLSQREGPLLKILLSTLLIILMAMVLTGSLLYTMEHPENFRPAPEVAAVAEEEAPVDEDLVENGIDVATGFIAEGDYKVVKTTCTACHSAKLVLQNRATREGWKEMIVWMQETQKLWDLGPAEEPILEYLATYYGPTDEGRRKPLQIEDWYMIE
jgi:hypothetical protein